MSLHSVTTYYRPIIISLSALLIAFTLSLTGYAQSSPNAKSDPDTQSHDHDQHHAADKAPDDISENAPDFVFTEAPDDHVIGSDFAPITVIAYASVTCSHCGNWFSNIWPDVKSELVDSEKIRFILREFPTAPAQLSVVGFVLAECAPEQDYMATIIHQMQRQTEIFELAQQGNAAQAFKDIAAIAGLDTDDEINACLSDPATQQHVQLSVSRAQAANVKGVPAFFVNGEAYTGDQSAQALTAHIDSLINTGSSQNPEQISQDPLDLLKVK